MHAKCVLRWAKSRQSRFLTKIIRGVNSAGNTGMHITDMIHATMRDGQTSAMTYNRLRYAFLPFLPPGVNSKGELVPPPSPQS